MPTANLRCLLFPVGSAGDVHPYLALGRELRSRGHDVRLFTNPHHQAVVERAGLAFHPVGTEDEFHRLVADPRMWHPQRGAQMLLRYAGDWLGPYRDLVEEHHVPGATAVVAPLLALGARIARDHLDVRLATITLQPMVIPSVERPPAVPGLPSLPKVPRPLVRVAYWVAAREVDRLLRRSVNQQRRELGLSPVRSVMHWWTSPDLELGLFPDWYAPPATDWPRQTRLCGFPLCDAAGWEEMSADLTDYLRAGPPPLVFTAGSAMRQGHRFFHTAAEVCRRLGRRGLLLTRDASQLPTPLPENVTHLPWVPLSALLPHAALLVHHGGIGTLSQALRAGVPQVVVPFAYDQFDNAARVETLGVGRCIARQRFVPHKAAGIIDELLRSPAVPQACQQVADRLAGGGSEAVGRAASEIERLVGPVPTPEFAEPQA